MPKALPLLVLAALPALLLTGCSGAQPDPAGYTKAVMAYADLNGPTLSASKQSDLQKTVLERGRRTCALLGKGVSTAAAQTGLTLDTTREGDPSGARAAFEWYELTTAGEYLCPDHAAVAQRIASTIPGFGTSADSPSDRYAVLLSGAASAENAPRS